MSVAFRAPRLGLTPLQARVIAWYQTHDTAGGDAGWFTSVRSLIRRKMLRREGEGRVSVTELGDKALRWHRASHPRESHPS